MSTAAVETTSEYATTFEFMCSSSSTGIGSGDSPLGCDSSSSHIARTTYASAVESEIEASKYHWSELDTCTGRDGEEQNFETKLAIFQRLRERWGDFFEDNGDGLVVGRKIAEGAQAEIFTAQLKDDDGRKWEGVVKVFKQGWDLQDLQKQVPKGMLRKSRVRGGTYFYYNSCLIYGGLLLKNGRFAFWMRKYWGDLRKLIEFRMKHNHSPPFTHSEVKHIMFSIAVGMQQLHEDKIIHKDLKAANILVQVEQNSAFNAMDDDFHCVVADFECSHIVVGTGYWRPPEILNALKTPNIKYSHLFSEKSDVYSYAMTCYEVLTGSIPFHGRGTSFHDKVIHDGKRPKLPSHISPMLRSLLNKCWQGSPSQRPSFTDIVQQLESIRLE